MKVGVIGLIALIDKTTCDDKQDAMIKERAYIDSLTATLNKIETYSNIWWKMVKLT